MDSCDFITPKEWESLTEDERRSICTAIHKEQKDTLTENKIKPPETFYAEHGKRALDLFIGIPAFIACIPLNLIIAVVTWFDVGFPILFVQERVGKNQKVFKLYKFRNMSNETNEKGILLPPHQRVTKWGKFVRKTSLDELLNFWNIIKGDMSVIGPRPLPQKYSDRFSAYHQQRHLVRPGLECPDHNRQTTQYGWKDRLDNDVWYVENVSFTTDVRMLCKLIRKVFSKEERCVSAMGEQGEFIGYDERGTVITEGNIPRKYLELLKTGA